MSAIYQGKIITKHISKYIHILLVHFDYQKYSFFNDENPCPTVVSKLQTVINTQYGLPATTKAHGFVGIPT